MDYLVDGLGIVATLIGVGVQLPQAYTIYRNRSTENINLATYVLYLFGSILWTSYAALKKDWVLLASSIFSSVVAAVILGLYYHFQRLNRDIVQIAKAQDPNV